MSSIDTTSYYSSLTGSDTTGSTTTTSDNTSLDQVDFLTLLTTQLEYQDPTNPVDNTEMVSQMTNYSMLDEDVQQNENLETIINQLDSLSALSTSGYIGEEVMADGGIITVEDGSGSDITIDLQEDAATLGLNIYDSEGTLVDTLYYTDVEAGTHEISGEDLLSSANIESDGTYVAMAFASDADDASVEVYVKSAGTITAVDQDDSGNTTLTLDDGREVSITDVTFI
ncbi:flagellar hook assembly protein FlgD [Desulfovibrio sp. JC010]|uniref:flagellar hook assembly protein FlgD n=1 Tax=Desulfovibrio sp. JC010 TaxID=2593641 RepID=UPI0013D0495F|nr:flagellar hook capping FlgD N-terminal domain-containing protein [Desulfovibrio sp. JC010]NDV25220.1 flagellar hook assembly protein FlgD [Desulfovibrio sp. JC010]